jgi:hypothetical protein
METRTSNFDGFFGMAYATKIDKGLETGIPGFSIIQVD